MKKFQFHLNSVLKYKEQVFETRLAEHAQALLSVNQQEIIVDCAERSFSDYESEYRRNQASGLTVVKAIEYQSGLKMLAKTVAEETELLCRLKKQEAEKKARVIEAKKDTASLNKLRDIMKSEYSVALQKEEEKLIDELITFQRLQASSD